MPSLDPGRLYLLHARADAPPVPEASLVDLLSPAERVRAGRFHFERDRRRYAVATGWLRWVLGRVLDLPPAALEFEKGEQGKPLLTSGLSFNLSHSGELILLALAGQGRVGVDIEVVRALDDLDALAARTLSKQELAELDALEEPAVRQRAFFRAWTRKEAFLKALGGGLSVPLDSFSVTLSTDSGSALRSVDDPRESVETWSVLPVPCAAEAEAAVAWDEPHVEVVPGEELVA